MDDVARLESLAQQLVARVRDTDPHHNQEWLHSVTTPEDREALLYVLAAAVPDSERWRDLVAWCADPRIERRRMQWREYRRRTYAAKGRTDAA